MQKATHHDRDDREERDGSHHGIPDTGLPAGVAGDAGDAAAATVAPARILVIGGEPERRAALVERLRRERHRCTHIAHFADARTAIARHRYDLLIVDPDLPDGNGLELIRAARRLNRATRAIVVSESGSVAHAVSALRSGAVDFILDPLDFEEIVVRVDAALRRSRSEVDRERRIQNLRRICRDLGTAREDIARQIDQLCDDVVSAYRDINERMDEVAVASEFRALLSQELDIEDVLRTMLEYLLTKTGPTNAAVFLPDEQKHYALGAYVNYDCPRESIDTLISQFASVLCPQMAREPELVAFDDSAEFAEWIGLDDGFFADSNVVAFSCLDEGRCLAVVILFRRGADPFPPQLAGTLDTLRTIFARHLGRLIRVHHRAKPSWPAEAPDVFEDYDDDFGFGPGGLAA